MILDTFCVLICYFFNRSQTYFKCMCFVVITTLLGWSMASEDGDNLLPTSKKLFINHIDTYQGINLAKVLYKPLAMPLLCTYRDLKMENIFYFRFWVNKLNINQYQPTSPTNNLIYLYNNIKSKLNHCISIYSISLLLSYEICCVQYLAGCVVGASLDDVEEEEEESEETEEQVPSGPKSGCYQIVGTLKDPEAKKPDFVKEILQVCEFYIRRSVQSIDCRIVWIWYKIERKNCWEMNYITVARNIYHYCCQKYLSLLLPKIFTISKAGSYWYCSKCRTCNP